MCSNNDNNNKNSRRGQLVKNSPTASTSRDVTSPDIITVSDCIATLSRAGEVEKMDTIFAEAVKQGVILRGNSLDMQWEVDLSGMALPVARAACRYLLDKIKAESDHDDIQDMVFITGVGKSHQYRQSPEGSNNSGTANILETKDPTTSLRDFIQGVLETDFDPPLQSTIPHRAQGTVVIERESLVEWLKKKL
jgi:hypothetical protein